MKFLVALAPFLLLAPAYAADLDNPDFPKLVDMKMPADWTGFYAGVYGAVQNGTLEYNGTVGPGFPYVGSGTNIGFGVQAGADYEFDNFVLGGVVDIGRSNLTADASGGGVTITSTVTTLGSVRARAGVAVGDLLAYVHGGAAFGHTDTTGSVSGFHGNDRLGYTLGAGLEVKVAENVSLFTEYAYTNLGSYEVFTSQPPAPALSITDSLKFHAVKAGVNFRF